MNCSRCGGPMTREKFFSSHEYFWGWRCISCGEILDETISENRQMFGKQRGSKAYRRRTNTPKGDML
jgi:hypothetical protein